MHRNLDRRVEVIVPVTDSEHLRELGELLDLGFDPGTASWWLDTEGGWTRHKVDDDVAPLVDLQNTLIGLHRRRRELVVSHR
jgi:polyphosphate kinase